MISMSEVIMTLEKERVRHDGNKRTHLLSNYCVPRPWNMACPTLSTAPQGKDYHLLLIDEGIEAYQEKKVGHRADV